MTVEVSQSNLTRHKLKYVRKNCPITTRYIQNVIILTLFRNTCLMNIICLIISYFISITFHLILKKYSFVLKIGYVKIAENKNIESTTLILTNKRIDIQIINKAMQNGFHHERNINGKYCITNVVY